MRRHVIIGRLGVSDQEYVPLDACEVATDLQFVSSNRRLEHGVGRAIQDLVSLNLFPSEIGVDLLIFAAHVHAADTRISRRQESQDAWTREIRLVVPVSDVNRWTSAAPLLRRMLKFLSGDLWTLGFRSRPVEFQYTVPAKPPDTQAPPYDTVGLFSGGVDSLIGTIDALERGVKPLLVSHAGDAATSDAQSKLLENLKCHYSQPRLERLRIWTNFKRWRIPGVKSENTSRARSFLFFAAGVFAGTGLNRRFTLRVPENGFIALNVPLDRLRLGSLSTRTTHPFYMARWNDLIEVLGIGGRVENQYWAETKGEMVARCKNKRLLEDLFSTSLSCASPAKARWQGRAAEHCGYCLPCLIRRAAILRGLGSDDPTNYTVDLTSKVLDTMRAEGKQVRAFQVAIERLRLKPKLASLLIHKPGPLSDESPERLLRLADVYRRGIEEVSALLINVATAPG